MNIKTTWIDGDYFTFEDYNRIANNILEIASVRHFTAPSFKVQTVQDVVSVEDINLIVDFINDGMRMLFAPSGFMSTIYPELRRFEPGCTCWSASEINTLERYIGLLRFGESFDS